MKVQRGIRRIVLNDRAANVREPCAGTNPAALAVLTPQTSAIDAELQRTCGMEALQSMGEAGSGSNVVDEAKAVVGLAGRLEDLLGRTQELLVSLRVELAKVVRVRGSRVRSWQCCEWSVGALGWGPVMHVFDTDVSSASRWGRRAPSYWHCVFSRGELECVLFTSCGFPVSRRIRVRHQSHALSDELSQASSWSKTRGDAGDLEEAIRRRMRQVGASKDSMAKLAARSKLPR